MFPYGHMSGNFKKHLHQTIGSAPSLFKMSGASLGAEVLSKIKLNLKKSSVKFAPNIFMC